MPQLEEPTTKNTQLCTGGLWGEKGKNKIFKKKKKEKERSQGKLTEPREMSYILLLVWLLHNSVQLLKLLDMYIKMCTK